MNDNQESAPLFFDWNATQVQLLCFGFVRKHLSDHNIQIDDMAKIVHQNCATATVDIGLIHNKFYGQVSNTKDLLNFLTNEITGDSTKKISLKYNHNIADSNMQASGIEVQCPDCNCTSVAYDSYTVVSLPVPTRYRKFEFTWIAEDVANPVVYGLQVCLTKLFFIFQYHCSYNISCLAFMLLCFFCCAIIFFCVLDICRSLKIVVLA